MNKQEALQDLVSSSVSRRKFAKSAMAAGFAIGTAGLIDGIGSAKGLVFGPHAPHVGASTSV